MACQTGQEIRDWSFSDEMGLLNSRGGLIASKWQHLDCKNCTSLALLSYAFSPKTAFLRIRSSVDVQRGIFVQAGKKTHCNGLKYRFDIIKIPVLSLPDN